MPRTAYAKGREIEKAAEHFLQRQGLQTITHNYRARTGEIDLIMQDGDTIVFVEVRCRETDHWGSALESINRQKQQRIISAAHHYLAQKQYSDLIRFDVVTYKHDTTAPSEWISNAFGIDD